MSIRRDVVLVVLATLAIGAAWAGLTPALQMTDEPAHVAYVQAITELGHPPRDFGNGGLLPDELTCWFDGLMVPTVRFNHAARPPWNPSARQALEERCEPVPRTLDNAQYHGFQPPGYYLLAAIPYEIASDAALPTRALLARLVSVLLAAFTAAATYLLIREVIPGSPWPARAGGLAVPLQPIFMFNKSAVNPDALVVAVAAGLALVLARIWRRGLDTRHAVALGTLVGVGLWSKANFLLLLPSVAFIAAMLWWASGTPGRGRRALRLAGSAAVALLFLGLLAVLDSEVWHRTLTYRQDAYSGTGVSVGGLVSHVRDFFLPGSALPGPPAAWVSLAQGVAARLGWWDDFGLPPGQTYAVISATGIVGLGAAVYVVPRARRRPVPPLLVVGAALLFLSALMVADYQFSLGAGHTGFEGRYMFPLIPLWGLVVAGAVASVRRRWQPAMAGLLVVAFLLHTAWAIDAMLIRYYL